MNKKIIARICFFSLLVFTAVTIPGLCQEVKKQPPAKANPSEAPKITLKGKVVYDQRTQSYMFHQQEPPYSVFFVMNENIDDLSTLAKSQKIITVAGSLPQGADFLLIDKVAGKKFGKK